MTKKLISMLLSIAMVLSIAVVGITGVSAAVDSDGRYVPSEGVETHRIYFAMPESWKNEKFGGDTAGAYWWNGSDVDGFISGTSQGVSWPGYKMQVENAENNIFYIDLPADVPNIIFNNYLNGGERTEDAETGKVTFEFGEEQFKAAMQTKDVYCAYYSEGDSTYYDDLLYGEFWAKAQEAVEGNDKTFLGNFKDNFFIDTEFDLGISMKFNNMIYVVNPYDVENNSSSGKDYYGGEFYFYYGLNKDTGCYEYGGLPNYEMAKSENLVYEIEDLSIPYEPPTIEGNKIAFDVKKSGWKNVKTVYCHMCKADGTGDWPTWQSKKERCKYDSSTGIATYELSKTGHNIKKSDGKLYCVIFSANTGIQTYTAIMGGKCIGDTLYCTGNKIENPEDSEKLANEAVWAKNKDCGPERRITSTGNVVGSAFPDGENDTTMMANYLIQYWADSSKTDKTDQLLKMLNLTPNEVMKSVDERLIATNNPDAERIKSSIERILYGGGTEPAPTVPTNVLDPSISKLENTAGGIKLSWNKVSGTYGYRLYRKTSSGWKRFKDTTATSFTDSAVSANQTKTYTIRCIDSSGNTISGFNSNGWSKKYTPVAPTISKLENTSSGIKLSWNKIAGVYGYRLYYKTSSGGWKRFKDTTATSFTDSGVSPNRTETYTIRCIDKNGKTVSGFNSKGWSKKYTATTPKITKLTNTSKGVSVTWNKVTGVYGYRLYRKYAGGSWTRVKDTTSTSLTDSGAKKGKKVTYTVRCIDKRGNTISDYNKTGWSITRK